MIFQKDFINLFKRWSSNFGSFSRKVYFSNNYDFPSSHKWVRRSKGHCSALLCAQSLFVSARKNSRFCKRLIVIKVLALCSNRCFGNRAKPFSWRFTCLHISGLFPGVRRATWAPVFIARECTFPRGQCEKNQSRGQRRESNPARGIQSPTVQTTRPRWSLNLKEYTDKQLLTTEEILDKERLNNVVCHAVLSIESFARWDRPPQGGRGAFFT